MNINKETICIIGLGWGSAGFLKYIDTKKYNVHVISKNSSFVYTPLLAQNIKNNRNLKLEIKDINNNINHTQNEVIDIDFKNNSIYTKNNNNKILYNFIILSHGGDINTFNIQGVNENCYFLKSSEDAIIIRDKLMSLPKLSKIAVIGCGLTGSEVIGTLIDYYKFDICAIDALPMPLSIFSKQLSNQAIELWKQKNVNMYFNHPVSLVSPTTIYFKNDLKPINYDMVLWCGGIKMSQFSIDIQKKLNLSSTKGIPVDSFLKVKDQTNIWAIGDCAYSGFPPTAQVAYQQGKYLAKQFNNKFKTNNSFEYIHKGQICYIGDKKSVYQYSLFTSGGNITYYLNNFIHLYNAINIKQSFNLFNKNTK